MNNIKSKSAIFLILTIIAIPSCLFANENIAINALPIKKQVTIEQIENQIKSERNFKTNLNIQSKKIKKQISDLKSTQISLVKKIQNIETNLVTTETKLKELKKKKLVTLDNLHRDKKEMADTILIIQRIERTPPETVIIKPGGPYQAAQATIVLKNILPLIKKQTDKLTKTINKLESLEINLNKNLNTHKTQLQQLHIETTTLNQLNIKKNKLFNVNKLKRMRSEIRSKRLAEQALDIKDLLKQIALDTKRNNAQRLASTHKNTINNNKIISTSSHYMMPVAGKIISNYGEINNIGAKNLGIEIKTRSGALISSPMDGIVKYTGFFKNYGNIIIIEHAKNYHSLIGNIEKIDTSVDIKLKAGEPIGYSKITKNNAIIYYELRYNGHPINPRKKIAQLN